jgi:hypothetical protein
MTSPKCLPHQEVKILDNRCNEASYASLAVDPRDANGRSREISAGNPERRELARQPTLPSGGGGETMKSGAKRKGPSSR